MQKIKRAYIIAAHLLYIFLTGNIVEARVCAYIDNNMILHKLSRDEHEIHIQRNNATIKNDFFKLNSKETSYEEKYSYNNSYFPSIYSIIELSALKNDVDPSLIMAIIKTESNFDKNSISPKGAQGLMQLMPETARGLHVSDPLDPKQNIAGGTRYLRSLLDNYNGKLELSLAAYNAGPGNVKDQIPNIPETKQYVSQVMGYYKKYRRDHQANK